MKHILIQNAIRRRRQEVRRTEPTGREIEDTATKITSVFFGVLAVLIIGSIAFAA